MFFATIDLAWDDFKHMLPGYRKSCGLCNLVSL